MIIVLGKEKKIFNMTKSILFSYEQAGENIALLTNTQLQSARWPDSQGELLKPWIVACW